MACLSHSLYNSMWWVFYPMEFWTRKLSFAPLDTRVMPFRELQLIVGFFSLASNTRVNWFIYSPVECNTQCTSSTNRQNDNGVKSVDELFIVILMEGGGCSLTQHSQRACASLSPLHDRQWKNDFPPFLFMKLNVFKSLKYFDTAWYI